MSEMNEFEKQVMEALRRVDAPAGFAERVMERSAEVVASHVSEARHEAPGVLAGRRAKVVEMRRRLHAQVWFGGAIAAMLAVGAFVGETVHVRHQREQAALATQQFEAAVRVTDQAIEQTRMQLQKAGLKLGD